MTAASAERHTTQYFEMHGNRGVYHEGWTAVTKHRTPWTVGQIELPDFEEDRWELYDTTTDWTQARDIAAEHPEKLAELQALFLAEAEKYDVLPLDDRFLERLIPELSGRKLPPSTMTLDRSMGRLAEDAVPNVKNTSWKVTADIEDRRRARRRRTRRPGRAVRRLVGVPRRRPAGVRAQLPRRRDRARDRRRGPCRPVRTPSRCGSRTTAAGSARAVTSPSSVDGDVAATGRLDRTVPFGYSIVESLNVGHDWGTPVSDRYSRGAGNPFTGELHTVTIATGDDAVQPTEDETLRAVLATH